MPKRSAEYKIERYRRKIKKLEKRKTHRVIESSESDEISDAEKAELPLPADEIPATNCNGSNEITNGSVDIAPPEPDEVNDQIETPELDPDILEALGEPTDEAPKFGPPIHNNLAQRWTPILKKGLTKEVKDKLLKEYPIPENCPLLLAPKLNPEISAAITDMSRNRDKKMEVAQQELGVGLTAINRALSLLLTGDDKIQVVKLLSDGCRILSDLHNLNTKARTKLVTPGLDKSFLNIIKDTDRDENLFGAKLSEKIKASKVIEKQGLQIKKTALAAKAPTPTPQPTTTRPRYQENWSGPSRYPPNRGGTRGGRKTTYTRRAPATTQSQKSSTTNKPRAAAQQ